MYQSTGYTITENTFKSNSDTLQTVGIIISNSGVDENEIYKNFFYNLHVGIQAIDKNSSQSGIISNPYHVSGLQFLCNVFNDTKQTDLLVGYSSSLPYTDHSVRKNQGDLLRPTGNEFFPIGSNRLNISNYSNYSIFYYYNDISLSETPFSAYGVVKQPLRIESDCSHLGKQRGYLEQALSQYDEWNAAYEYWSAKLLAFEGDNEEEYNMLYNMVSYYSALKDNYFNSVVVAVNSMWYAKSGDEEEGGKQKAESEDNLFETLRFLFNYRNQYTDNLSVAETYLAERNYSEALASLDKIYAQFEINEEQTNELQGLKTYIYWLQELEEKGKTIYKLPEEEIAYLVKYVENNTGRGTVFANNILCALYGICLEEESGVRYAGSGNNETMRVLDDEIINQSKSAQSALSEFYTQALENITLVPNPTTGELKVESGELKVTSVEVFDVYGRKIPILWRGQRVVNISHLSAGIYFVKIVTEAGEVVKKVMKQ
jgi:tetratricopeptide (TPR) repeat protein